MCVGKGLARETKELEGLCAEQHGKGRTEGETETRAAPGTGA